MTELVVVATSDLDAHELDELRMFLEDAFDGAFAEEDWEHTLGGAHVLLRESGVLVGHASVVPRQLLVGDQPFRTGYVEGVAVRADRRGRRHGNALMEAAEGVVRTYDLGALSAADRARRLYERRGWLPWSGETWVLAPAGLVRTPEDDGGVLVLPTPTSPELDRFGPIACDWRSGDVW